MPERNYSRPARVGKKHIGAYLPEDLAFALSEKLRKEGSTVQEAFERFATEYVGSKDLPLATRKRLLEVKMARERHALGLS